MCCTPVHFIAVFIFSCAVSTKTSCALEGLISTGNDKNPRELIESSSLSSSSSICGRNNDAGVAADVDSGYGRQTGAKDKFPLKDHRGKREEECNRLQEPWMWDPSSLNHPCNIKQFSYHEFFHTFGMEGLPKLHHEPIVIRHGKGSDDNRHLRIENIEFAELTSLENITRFFPPGFEVTLSSSNSFSDHRKVVTLKQYLLETISTEILPSHLSNETWYLFGETYTEQWKRLLLNYKLPPCVVCTRELSALSFGIGGRGSGVQWHVHGPGFSESLHGRKHWILYPPNRKPRFDSNFTSRHWMEYTYSSLQEGAKPYECTLEPLDLIYFPDGWYHATLNLDMYTAFISTFTTEHL